MGGLKHTSAGEELSPETCEHGHCDCGHDHEGHHRHEDACVHGHCDCGHDHEGHHHEDACEHERCHCGHDHAHEGHHHGDACGCGCAHEHMEEHELEGSPTFVWHVVDLDCPSCAMNVQNAVRALPTVADARVTYATSTLEVVAATDADGLACRRQVLEAVRSCGEDLALSDEERQELEAERSWFAENRERVLMGLSGMLLVAGLVCEHLMRDGRRANVYYVLSALAGLVFIMPMALASLKRRKADMNVLMSIAVIGALIIGFTGDESVFCDAAIVIFLDQVGEWLEGWSMRRTSGSIRQLMELAPDVAHVVSPDGSVVDVLTKGVGKGYTIRVLPGERVPLDGEIVAGESAFNEAPVTGESVPADKGVGAEVYAGSLNANGVVDVLVTADADCTTLARIVSQVQGAQARKAPYESFVNRFAETYTPIVIVGAAILGICVPLFLSVTQGPSVEVWHDWVYRACSLLVVACPCALVISTPVSFVSALSRAAREGILVKGGAYFDIACRVRSVAFDKTGTLTEGMPRVVEVVPLSAASADEVVCVAAALEAGSTHPVARAITQDARERGCAIPEAQGIVEVAACGMRGDVGGRGCLAGKPAFVADEVDLCPDALAAVERIESSGATVTVVVELGEVTGLIGVADTLRESAAGCVGALRAGRPARDVWMLTGDNARAARHIAHAAGIDDDNVVAELVPEEKLERVRELTRRSPAVCMVGDGINDAPALAQADLGVTMGAAASDTALEVADVALLAGSLEHLPYFFELSRKTMNVVRENISFAILVKVCVFVLVSLGMAGMGAAVFADTGVALIVILNGMRLMRRSRLGW